MKTPLFFVTMLAAALVAGCKPICPERDLGCLTQTLQVTDLTADLTGEGTKLTLSVFDTTRFGDAQELSTADGGPNAGGGVSIKAATTLNFETSVAFGVIFFTFTDSLECRPALCFTPCPKNVRCLSVTSCTPSVRDGLPSGSGFHRVEYASQPATETSFELLVTPVSAPGCPESVVQALLDDTALVGLSSVVKLHIPGADGSGQPSAPVGGGTGGSGGGVGGGAGRHCDVGSNYCMDPGGGGVDACCPAASPYYCKNPKTCISTDDDAFFNGSCGTKYFCSSDY